jgi:hypothetical protein
LCAARQYQDNKKAAYKTNAISRIFPDSIGSGHAAPLNNMPRTSRNKLPGTQTQSETRNFLVNIHLCVFGSWWRKCFAKKCTKTTTKVLT